MRDKIPREKKRRPSGVVLVILLAGCIAGQRIAGQGQNLKCIAGRPACPAIPGRAEDTTVRFINVEHAVSERA